jgi:hypothetical protein
MHHSFRLILDMNIISWSVALVSGVTKSANNIVVV